MSVIIRLQNLPWSANALDIRNFFRGLSIPEGGVHIVGGELGDAFIAFSTDEDARQAMMLDGGKIKEIQVKLLLSSRSEMHKVIEAARQSVPILSLAAPAPVAPAPAPAPAAIPSPTPVIQPPIITPFSAALGNNPISGFGIPGIGNPQEIPQPAVIEPPAPMISPDSKSPGEEEKDEEKNEKKRSKEKDRRRTRSRSRSRDRKDRKRDRRDRSRSRDRRRRSRSRDRRDRKRDRKDRSRSRDRSPSRRSRDRRNFDRNTPQNSRERSLDNGPDGPGVPPIGFMNPINPNGPMSMIPPNAMMQNGPPMVQPAQIEPAQNRFNDPSLAETFNKLQELGKKRNPNAFQGDQQNGNRFQGGRGGNNSNRGGGSMRRDGRPSRFDDQQKDCCVAIRNAPNHTSYGDVRRFFPFMIDKHGIKMINDNMGRRSGNILVRFCDVRSKQLALQRKVNELKGAQVIVEPLSDEDYECAVDSFLPYRDENDDEDQSLVIADAEDTKKLLKPYNVLKFVDLPHFVKELDIMKSLSDFSLLSILINDCRKTRSKIAYVQFANHEDAGRALERKDTYVYGRRHATVTPLSDEEFEKVKMAQEKVEEPMMNQPMMPANIQMPEPIVPRDPRQRRQQADNGPAPLVAPQMQGGPNPQQFFTNAQFPQNFGTPFPGAQFGAFQGAVPIPGPNPSGPVDPRAAAASWANRPNFPQQAVQAQVPPSKPQVINLEEDEPLDCVLMKGLPREATDRTIVNFLSDTGAVPARIHLMLDQNGLPSGDCFCEFRSAQEARQAVTKHGKTLDGCRVTVDMVMRSVVEEALEGPKNDGNRDGLLGAIPPGAPYMNMNAPRGGFADRGQFRGRGGFDRGGFDRGGFNRGGFDQGRGGFDQGRGGFDQGRGGFDQGRGGFDKGRGGFEKGRGGFDQGRGGFGQNRGGFDSGRGRGKWNERGGRGRGRGFGGRGRGGYDGGGGPPRGEDTMQDGMPDADPMLDGFGAPGCVVSMENVPFRASVDDIMSFFGEFELSQDDVIRRYNERGQPTGDARVAFRTPFDAQRAVKTRHMDTIFDRRINLTIL